MSTTKKTEHLVLTAELHVEAAVDMAAEQRFDEAIEQWLKAAALFSEAGAAEREQEAALRAGLLFERVGDLAQALAWLERAVELARVPGAELSLGQALAHLSRVAVASGRVKDGVTYAHEAMDLGERTDDPRLIGAMALALGEIEAQRGTFDEAERVLEVGRVAWSRAKDEEGLGQIANARGELARARGLLEAAEVAFREAVNHFMLAKSASGLAVAMANQGNLARAQGDLDSAETLFQASFNMAQAAHDGPGIARAHTNLGNLAAMRGDLAGAKSRYERALALDRRWGQVRAVAGGLVNLASIAATEGRLDAALESYGKALDALTELRASRRTFADLLTMMGQLEARLGRLGPAERRFAQAAEHAAASHHALGAARLEVCRAALTHARGDVARALSAYRQAVPTLEAVGGASDLATVWLVVADAALATSDVDGAQAALDAAATRVDEGQREALDLAVLAARVRLAAEPSLAARAALVAAADALAAAGRETDALTARLAALDLGLDPAADRALVEVVAARAEALQLAPLRIDARSAWLALTGADPRDGEALVAEADALGLGLLGLRVRRRWAAALDLVGQREAAADIRREAREQARRWGATAELSRLDAAR